MKAFNFKSSLPYLIAILVFLALTSLYFSPLFVGKTISQSDHSSYIGSSQEMWSYYKKDGKHVMWTNSMFSGMPTTTIAITNPGNVLQKIAEPIYSIPRPVSDLVVGMVGFYILLLMFGVNPWLSMIGAIAFAFCSYNFQIIQVGHNTKVTALSYVPWVFAAFVYTLRRRMLLGATLFAAALALEVLANHPQVTYYLAFLLFFFWIGELITARREKTLKRFTQATLLLVVAALLGFGSNINRLWPTYEYSTYTTRGGSELNEMNPSRNQSKGGLDIEYATAWSYGIAETMNLLIPDFYGGASGGELSKKSHTYRFLKENGAPNADEIVKQLPLYWGPQPFTAGPMYMGAVTIFLFVLGLFLIKGVMKWWVIALTVLVLFLGWGKHMMWFSSFFYDYFPLYNKFRVPSMILVLLEITLPLFGFYALNRLLSNQDSKAESLKGLKRATAVTAGVCALFALIPSLAGSFVSPADAQYPDWLRQLLPEDRTALLRADAMRSLLLILFSAFIIYLGYTRKIKSTVLYLGLGAIILFDLWGVDKRYMNNEHFVTKRMFENVFQQRPVDKAILTDKTPHYRVLDLAVNTFNDAHSAYNHKMIGGYSAAKLQRYQDIIDLYLQPEITTFAGNLQAGVSMDSALQQMPIVSMLNGKYIITNPNSAPIVNTYAFGNGWFIDRILFAASADEEIALLQSIDPRHSAIVSQELKDVLHQIAPVDSSATITLKKYSPNELIYESVNPQEGVALFSEVFYPKGWKAYIDDKEVTPFRANYILRALQIPAGKHEIRFEFYPDSYRYGSIIAYTSSGIILTFLLFFGIRALLKKKRE